MCVAWLNQLDNNLLYRGCLKNISSLKIANDLKDLVYYVCSSDFCNDVPLNMSSTKAITTTSEMPKKNSTIKIQNEERAILKSSFSESNAPDSQFENGNDTEIESCDDDNSLDYDDITVELEVKPTISLANSSKSFENYQSMSEPETKSITCYFCNARWPVTFSFYPLFANNHLILLGMWKSAKFR